MNEQVTDGGDQNPAPASSRSTDWYADGDCRRVIVDGVEITVRVVGRRGRRTRIEIVAPAGAGFEQEDG